MVSQRKVRACVRACVATSCGVLRMALVRDRGFDPATAEHLRTSSSGSSSGSSSSSGSGGSSSSCSEVRREVSSPGCRCILVSA